MRTRHTCIKAIHSEKGQVLPIVLVVLALGTFLVVPFLAHASTGMIVSTQYASGVKGQYAADSGVEHAIWRLLYDPAVPKDGSWTGESWTLPSTINSDTVNVAVVNEGGGTYRITSIATSSQGPSTTIVSRVSWNPGAAPGLPSSWPPTVPTIPVGGYNGNIFVNGDAPLGNNDTVNGSLYVTGTISLANNGQITGDVVAGGNISISNNGNIDGNISATGNVTLGNNTQVGSTQVGGTVCAGGNLYLNNNTIVYGSVRTSGNVSLANNCSIRGNVFVEGDIQCVNLANNAMIQGNVYIIGSITDTISLSSNARIWGDIYATGTVDTITGGSHGNVHQNYTSAYPSPPACVPMPEGGGLIVNQWE